VADKPMPKTTNINFTAPAAIYANSDYFSLQLLFAG
jgi:hypothetical protein